MTGPLLLAAAVLLGACGLLGNCWQCANSMGFRNISRQPVDLAYGDERGMRPSTRLEPGQKVVYNFSTPRQGDLRRLFIIVRATDPSGETVFCERMSWRAFNDRPSGTIDIVRGDVRC